MSLIIPALDLEVCHFQRIKHGIRVYGTWLRKSRTSTAPCLVLIDANKLAVAGVVVPVVIPIAEAWRYAVSTDAGGETIGDPEHVARSIAEWLQKGFLSGSVMNSRDHLRILDAINDNIRDLYHMPPTPPSKPETKIVLGDMTTTDRDTGQKTDVEISINV